MTAPSAPRSRPPCFRPIHWRRVAQPTALALLVGAFCPLALGGGSAGAFRGWCRADPEVQIAGHTAHVQLALDVPNMHVAQQLGVGKPIHIILSVPHGVDARLLAVDRGFGEGYDFQVQPSSDLKQANGIIPVKIQALIPMQDDGLAVRVAFVPAGSASDQQVASGKPPGPARSHGPKPPQRPDRSDGSGSLAFASSAGTANKWVSVLANQ